MYSSLLSIITYLPLAGVLLVILMGRGNTKQLAAKWVGFATSLAVLVLSVMLWCGFDPKTPGLQFEQRLGWMTDYGMSYHTGLDGISLVFILLTAVVTPLTLMVSWNSVKTQISTFTVTVLLLETALFGLFSAQDLILFYIFYEATLIPASLMIGVWGGRRRIWASLQYFLFTFGGSLFMLLALVAMWLKTGTTDIQALMNAGFSHQVQGWLLLAFILAFGVKLPLFPLHAWLPDAYTEAPAPASAMLSGILSKAGAYGLLRFGILMFPEAAHAFAPYVLALGVVAIIYAAYIAFAQTDMKRVIAYSSFSHMGMIAVGLFTLTAEGIDGAILQMLSHGIVIAALFFCVSVIAVRAGTREIGQLGGVARQMPLLATFAMLFTMANVGLPGTSSFAGELLVIMGAVHVSLWVALLAGTTMIMGAVYMLYLYKGVLFGTVRETTSALRDLTMTEVAVLAPLAVIILWMGIYPGTFTRLFDPVVTQSVQAELMNRAAADHTAMLQAPHEHAVYR